MLHAPDFLGYEDAIQMAQDHPEIVQRGLRLKKTGNEIMSLIGGREVHPINIRVGGFYRVPGKSELLEIRDRIKRARDEALENLRWVSTLSFPDFEQDYEFVALSHADEYPFNEGRIVSNKGLNISTREFDDTFSEEHVSHSNALHCVLKERGAYFVGPAARYSLNFDKLSPLAREAAREAGLSEICRNPFKSIIVRSVEVLYAFDEALRIIDDYEPPELPAVKIEPRAGVGYACTEAPRGSLYHRYEVDERGLVRDAKIVPPTYQNQKTIENDLWQVVSQEIDLPKEKLTWRCEQAVRNYDPCISCATHFLRLNIERE
jgi:coenzyme F420-reducing hydrogenase alpha subunit